MIEKAIYKILSDVVQLGGVNVYFGTIPQVPNLEKYIVFYRNGTTPYDSKSGRSTLDAADIQCGIVVQSIQFNNQVTMFEFNDTYNTKGLYQISQYYSCRVEPQYLP